MNLPISPISGTVTAAIAAARLAATAVQQVANVVADQASGAISFGEVLQGEASSADPPAESADLKDQLDDLKNQFAESTRKTLATLGVGPDEAVSLSIDQSGRIELSGDNPTSIRDKAAQIEAVLAADTSLSSLAQQILSASGTSQATLQLPPSGNLTIPPPQANIGTRFGG